MQLHHTLAALLACAVLPAVSRLGDGRYGWTMFSGSFQYRLRVDAIDARGDRHPIAPTELAVAAGSPAAEWLAGADHLRRGAGGRVMRAHLDALAAFACTVAHARRVELVLAHQAHLDAPMEERFVGRDCGR